MKTKIITILAIVAVMQSCKKKEEEIPAPSTPVPSGSVCYVKTIEASGYDWAIYNFNSDFKVASYQTLDLFTEQMVNNTITYSGNTMTTKKYNTNNVLVNTEVAQLNGSGYMTSSISAGIDSLYGGSTPKARNVYDTASYQYDANGFLITEIHRTKNVVIGSGDVTFEYDTTSFVIQNENIVSSSQKIMFVYQNGQSSQTSNNSFTYGTMLNKSGQTVGAGISSVILSPFNYKGKKSKNLAMTSTSQGNSPYTYTYILNSDGYVTQQTGDFAFTFTYNCH